MGSETADGAEDFRGARLKEERKWVSLVLVLFWGVFFEERYFFMFWVFVWVFWNSCKPQKSTCVLKLR